MFLNLDQKGFTLLDAVIAAGVLGLGMMAYASLQGNLLLQGKRNANKSQAVTLAQDKLESIKSLSRTVDLPENDSLNSPIFENETWSGSIGENLDSEGNVQPEEDEYKRTWTIKKDSELFDFFNIKVSVTWKPQSNGVIQKISLNTQITQNKTIDVEDEERLDKFFSKEQQEEIKDLEAGNDLGTLLTATNPLTGKNMQCFAWMDGNNQGPVFYVPMPHYRGICENGDKWSVITYLVRGAKKYLDSPDDSDSKIWDEAKYFTKAVAKYLYSGKLVQPFNFKDQYALGEWRAYFKGSNNKKKFCFKDSQGNNCACGIDKFFFMKQVKDNAELDPKNWECDDVYKTKTVNDIRNPKLPTIADYYYRKADSLKEFNANYANFYGIENKIEDLPAPARCAGYHVDFINNMDGARFYDPFGNYDIGYLLDKRFNRTRYNACPGDLILYDNHIDGQMGNYKEGCGEICKNTGMGIQLIPREVNPPRDLKPWQGCDDRYLPSNWCLDPQAKNVYYSHIADKRNLSFQEKKSFYKKPYWNGEYDIKIRDRLLDRHTPNWREENARAGRLSLESSGKPKCSRLLNRKRVVERFRKMGSCID